MYLEDGLFTRRYIAKINFKVNSQNTTSTKVAGSKRLNES